MKGSVLPASFAVMKASGSNDLSSPAMRLEKADASNFVIGPMPDAPLIRPSQVELALFPKGVSMPMPVMTTRGFT
jgi:hypothetical protein